MPVDHENQLRGGLRAEQRRAGHLKLKLFSPATLVVVVALAAFAAAAGPASATTSPVVGHVYVNDNTAVANTVAGFDRHADGSLTPISGSPFATGGAIASDGSLTLLGNTPLGGGVNTPFDARLAPDGETLWVLDTGSATVSGFAVSGRSLSELSSSPTS